MPTSRLGRIAAFACFALMLALSLATEAYFAYRLTYPPRVLKIKIVADSMNPAIPGYFQDVMKAQVESLSGFFEQTAGIRLSVIGFANLPMPAERVDPNVLRRFIDVRTPRDEADIMIAFWAAPPGDPRLGSALPYTSTAIVRVDPGQQQHNQLILAHQLLTLFGVAASPDGQSVMHVPPTKLSLDSLSKGELMDTRMFDFSHGLAGMSRRLQVNVMRSIEREIHAHPPADSAGMSHMIMGDLYLRDGQFVAAAEQYRGAVRSNSSSLAAHLALSLALVQSGKVTEAEAEARTCVKLAPNQGDSHYRLGFVLVRSGNPEGAIPEFRQAIAMQPNSIRNRTGLAVAYAASIGEFDAAEHEFQEALKIEPQNPALLADIDYVNRLRARVNKQLETAEAALQLHPESGIAHDAIGLLLLRLGQVDRSVKEAREALRLGPDTWHPHYTLALALYAQRDYAGSSAELANAKKLGSGARPFLEESLRNATSAQPTK